MRTVVIASCSSSSNVHASLKQSYRLGSPMLLTEPSLLDKRDVLLSLMLDPNVAVVVPVVNIDILLGASSTTTTNTTSDDDGRGSDGRGSDGRGGASSSGVKKERITRDRTRHKSIDRILSTLLVEIDGLHSHGSLDLPTVIVIATSCSMDCLDRLILVFICYH